MCYHAAAACQLLKGTAYLWPKPISRKEFSLSFALLIVAGMLSFVPISCNVIPLRIQQQAGSTRRHNSKTAQQRRGWAEGATARLASSILITASFAPLQMQQRSLVVAHVHFHAGHNGSMNRVHALQVQAHTEQ